MFISNILKITDCKRRFVHDRTALLRDIIKSFLLKIPFQNVTSFGAIKMLQREKPGFRKVLEACLYGSGGMCGHSNYFLKLQLDALGYTTHVISGVFRRTGIPSSHLALVVSIPYTKPQSSMLGLENPKPNLYVVDVGCGVPIHEPILVNKLPYYGRAGGLDYRYEMTGVGHVQRVNVNGDALVGPKPGNYESPQDYTIDLSPKPRIEHFDDSQTQVYKSYDTIFLHQGFYIFRYLDISENDFKVVWIRGKELIFATKETRSVTSFENIRELQPVIHEYFPMIRPEEVEQSMINFTQFKIDRERIREQTKPIFKRIPFV